MGVAHKMLLMQPVWGDVIHGHVLPCWWAVLHFERTSCSQQNSQQRLETRDWLFMSHCSFHNKGWAKPNEDLAGNAGLLHICSMTVIKSLDIWMSFFLQPAFDFFLWKLPRVVPTNTSFFTAQMAATVWHSRILIQMTFFDPLLLLVSEASTCCLQRLKGSVASSGVGHLVNVLQWGAKQWFTEGVESPLCHTHHYPSSPQITSNEQEPGSKWMPWCTWALALPFVPMHCLGWPLPVRTSLTNMTNLCCMWKLG